MIFELVNFLQSNWLVSCGMISCEGVSVGLCTHQAYWKGMQAVGCRHGLHSCLCGYSVYGSIVQASAWLRTEASWHLTGWIILSSGCPASPLQWALCVVYDARHKDLYTLYSFYRSPSLNVLSPSLIFYQCGSGISTLLTAGHFCLKASGSHFNSLWRYWIPSHRRSSCFLINLPSCLIFWTFLNVTL